MNRGSEDMKLWLFDLAHGNLSDEQVLKGFTKYYTLAGFVPGNVQQDMVFHTCYSQEQIASAMAQLIWALQILAGEGGANNESELRLVSRMSGRTRKIEKAPAGKA